MSIAALSVEPEDARRTRILEAAERAFARHGFHAASMQIVAAEARMSAGNLYRYFSSKEALVSGLAERDQAALAEDFGRLETAGDMLGAMAALLRKHLVSAPIGGCHLALEIWAEAGRNPAVAEVCRGIERVAKARLAAILAGPAEAVGLTPDFAVRVMLTVTAGLFKRRATEQHFDGEAEIALALAIYRALFAGTIRPGAGAGAGAPA